jgi:hypothetical protein
LAAEEKSPTVNVAWNLQQQNGQGTLPWPKNGLEIKQGMG